MLQFLAPLIPKLAEGVFGLVDDLHVSDEEKAAAALKANQLAVDFLSQTDKAIAAEMEAKKQIIVAEMQSGDSFTKRARPMVVYVGLAAIVLNHVLAPWLFALTTAFTATPVDLPAITLPEEFWWAWTGVCSVWFIGRSAERRGLANKVVSGITGNK